MGTGSAPTPAETVERFLRSVPVRRGDRLLAAFSGGADSSALLILLREAAPRLGLRLQAAHLDHGADADSGRRAGAAVRLARELGVPLHAERVELPRMRRAGESLEEAGRRVRYAFLERIRRMSGAGWVATAHHRDDQAETVLLRLLQGSGWRGLAAIAPLRGRVLRPLLDLPRSTLLEIVERHGIEPVVDPTNRDPDRLRNLVRHRLLPRLEGRGELASLLARTAAAARGARTRVDRLLARVVDLRETAGGVPTLDARALGGLPDTLGMPALALLHRAAGAAHPPSTAARRELLRTLRRGGRLEIDAGGDRVWRVRDGRLGTAPRGEGNTARPFAYTLHVPGDVQIPELGAVLSLRRGEPNDAGSAAVIRRERLSLPAEPGTVLVRNRRPGDRIVPAGRRNRKRLKEVLIDQRIPRRQRDALPLLVVEGEVAWVPGVAVAEGFGPAAGGTCWTAELSSTHGAEVDPS